MKKVITLLAMLLSLTSSFSQEREVKMEVFIENEKVPESSFKIQVIEGADTTIINVHNDRFLIPAKLYHNKATVHFLYDEYNLKFTDIPITYNESNPKWQLKIDKRPFEDENLRLIGKRKKPKIIYTFINGIGSQITAYR